jgi:arsenate-mycothiol transferase
MKMSSPTENHRTVEQRSVHSLVAMPRLWTTSSAMAGSPRWPPLSFCRAAAGRAVAHSTGTDPGRSINVLSPEVLSEVGADMSGEAPKPIDPGLLRTVDLVVTLGREAHVDAPDGTELRNWDTDGPSERGIDGIERMRLIRDDIHARVRALVDELTSMR